MFNFDFEFRNSSDKEIFENFEFLADYFNLALQ